MMTNSAWSFRSHFRRWDREQDEYTRFTNVILQGTISRSFWNQYIYFKCIFLSDVKTCLNEARQQTIVSRMTRRGKMSFSGSLRVQKREYFEKSMHLVLWGHCQAYLKNATIKKGEMWMWIDFWRDEIGSSPIIFDYKTLYHMLLDSHRVMNWCSLSRNERHVCWWGVSVLLSWFWVKREGCHWSLWTSVTRFDIITIDICNFDYRRNPDDN